MNTSTFDAVLESIERLSPDEQEALIDVVKRRLIEKRRAQIAENIAQAKADHQAGKVFRGTVDDVMAELNH